MRPNQERLLKHLRETSPSLAAMLEEIEVLTQVLNTKFRIEALGLLVAQPVDIIAEVADPSLEAFAKAGVMKIQFRKTYRKRIQYVLEPDKLGAIKLHVDRLMRSLFGEEERTPTPGPACPAELARHIFSSPSRLAVVCLLFEMNVHPADLEDWLGIHIATSHIHLGKLKEVGLSIPAHDPQRGGNAAQLWNPNKQAIFDVLCAVKNLLSGEGDGS
ncbi:MAG TPA: hypothetical protein VNG90_01100 [Candidatus Acidoferrum sp.]|nr:hypothetical protein [Candidatus Acidoferrum sp.]